jgi:hypothetical protein
MEFTATYVQLTYTLLVGVFICLGWAFSLKREVAVLSKIVEIHKTTQDSVNVQVEKKFERIEEKLDHIISLLVKNGKN